MRIDPVFDQVATRYLASLTHLHSPHGHHLPVCEICLGPTGMKPESGERWDICWPCREHQHAVGIAPGELANSVSFIIYALEKNNGSPDQSLLEMYQYKLRPLGKTGGAVISPPGQRVRTLLYVALRDNLEPIAHRDGRVEVIAHVPSTSTHPNRDPRALAEAVDSAVSKLFDSPPHHQLLVPGITTPGSSRVIEPERFQVVEKSAVAGRHVLLVEDTWVTGASAQSAAVALHRAGARQVTVLCVARMLRETWSAGKYLTSQYASCPPPQPGQFIFPR